MLEVLHRDGLARVALWEPVRGGASLRTPAVLFHVSPRHLPFDRAEAYVTTDPSLVEDAGGRPVIVDGGGPFHGPSSGAGAVGAVADADIPPSRACPTSLAAYKAGEAAVGADGVFLVAGPTPPADVPEGVEVVVAGNIMQLIGDPKRLVGHLCALREAVGYSRLIYAPGAGRPDHMALLSYLGVDLFDSIPAVMAAARGEVLFPDGAHAADDLGEDGGGICDCRACRGAAGDDWGRERLLDHNQCNLVLEGNRLRHAIPRGLVRNMVERRVRSAPWMVAALRELDLRHHATVERYMPISKPFLAAVSRESLHMPEVVRFQRRLRERYRRPPSASVLLLLPCSARKPYSKSSTHKAIARAVSRCASPALVHRVVLTSPLGVVPMELELSYPANTYDIAVTGDWDLPEVEMIRDGLGWLLGVGGYKAVVSFIDGMPFIEELVAGHAGGTVLRPRDPRRREDLDALVGALDDALSSSEGGGGDGGPAPGWKERAAEDVASAARFQFGAGGEGLVDRVRLGRGRTTLFLGGEMTGTLNDDRGLVSLTLRGGEVLHAAGAYVVEIDDFDPKGTVFAIGVKGASGEIRPGDDVVVSRGGDAIGVGVARMSGPEMVEARRGPAVALRHKRK